MGQEIQLRIRKINCATLRLESELDIAMMLSETFRFQAEGYKFSPAYKQGIWDGYIRLFNIGNRTIASGLFDSVVEFCNNNSIVYEVVDDFKNTGYEPPNYKTPDVDEDSIRSYITSLDIYSDGDPIVVRDYQIKGVTTAIKERQAIIVAVTGSGKSCMIYCIFRYITEVLGLRALLIVPTIGLTTQIKSDFIDYSSNNGYDVEKNVHLISGGCEKTTDKPIVISTFQSLSGVNGVKSDWLNSFGLIMADEGHKIQAKSFQDIYGKATQVPFRLTCTGTMHDTKCNVLTMIGLTGPVHEIATAKDLIALGQLTPLKIKSVIINYPLDICKAFKKVEYEDEIKWLINNSKRNNFIKNLALKCVGTTLIFFRFREQGKILYDLIKEAAGPDMQVFLMDGLVDKDEREIIRKISNLSATIIVASYGTMSTGINVPGVENMVIAHPIKGKITFLQSIGRGLRLKDGKLFCNLFDIGDNMTYKSKPNTTFNHFGDRMVLLTKEGYQFNIVNINF